MPGHIFARLGLWSEDIEANSASVEASRAAEARHESGWMDQFHSDDFLVYAYLQSGQEAKARAVVDDANAAIAHYESMPGMAPDHYMAGMFPYYRAKLPIFIDLETRDWTSALAIGTVAGAPPETQTQVYWARAIAAGHLRRPAEARQASAGYDALIEELRKGPHAYYAEGNGTENPARRDRGVVRVRRRQHGRGAQGHARQARTSRTRWDKARWTFRRAKCWLTCCSRRSGRRKRSRSTPGRLRAEPESLQRPLRRRSSRGVGGRSHRGAPLLYPASRVDRRRCRFHPARDYAREGLRLGSRGGGHRPMM